MARNYSLTDDEFAVLMIASRGEYMLAIGRWESSTKNLAARGLMQLQMLNGGPQYTITDAGRAAIARREAEENQELATIVNKFRPTDEIKERARQAANLLAGAAKLSAPIFPRLAVTARRARALGLDAVAPAFPKQ